MYLGEHKARRQVCRQWWRERLWSSNDGEGEELGLGSRSNAADAKIVLRRGSATRLEVGLNNG